MNTAQTTDLKAIQDSFPALVVASWLSSAASVTAAIATAVAGVRKKRAARASVRRVSAIKTRRMALEAMQPVSSATA